MALTFYSGSFTSRTNTGTDVISGVGFTPKVIIFYSCDWTGMADETFGVDLTFRMGWAVDTTAANQKSIDCYSEDAVATSNSERGYSAASAICAESSPSMVAIGVVSVIGADGFTVNWTTNDGTAKKISYICLGGADITNTKVGQLTSPAAGGTGNQTTTGVGFQPDIVMFISTGQTDGQVSTQCVWGVGFATGSADQACLCGISKTGQATMITKRYQRTDNSNCFALLDTATPTSKALEGSLVSMNADGFTINWTTVITSGASKSVAYLAIKGGNFEIDAITSPTAGTPPVSQQTTAVGFQPVGLLMASTGKTSGTTIVGTNRISIGGGTSSTAARNAWAGDTDAVADSITARTHRNNKIVSAITEAATQGNSTINASASITSLDTDGFTLSWDARDTNAYEVIYVAFGNAQAAKTLYIAKAFYRSDG